MDKNKKIDFWNNEEFRGIFDETALLQLGVYFYFGHDNIEQNVDKAIKIWWICDELYDSGEACFFLGKAYSNNDDEMFYETTMKYYQKALDKGVEEAYFPLGYEEMPPSVHRRGNFVRPQKLQRLTYIVTVWANIIRPRFLR